MNIGSWGSRIKSGNTQISPELREEALTLFPKQFENQRQAYIEEQITEALELYKRDHEDSTHIPAKAEVTLKDGTNVKLGQWGNRIKKENAKIKRICPSVISKSV